MKYECTDCSLCASFQDGFRVICLSPDQPADSILEYLPVGDGDAEDCPRFDEGSPEEWSGKKYHEASTIKGDDTTWEDIKE